jgi:DNA polymerase-3 subunit delta'
MAEEKPDPRETPWHPRHARYVRGHKQARDTIAAVFASGKAHHAWLLAGPRGIGKATVAYAIARGVLSGIPAFEFFAHEPVGQHAKWIESRAHPDLFVLERAFEDKRLKTEIVVDDAREVGAFLFKTSGSSPWRVAIVDAADDLNNAAANSLLKVIEEPPPKTLLLLVTHRPGRVLRTIRSRCAMVKFEPMTESDTLAVLHGLPLAPKPGEDALRSAVSMSGGSPGRCLELLNSAGAKAFEDFQKSPPRGNAQTTSFAMRHFNRIGSQDDVKIFAQLLLEWLGHQAKSAETQPKSARLASAYQDIAHSIRQANALNLDQRQTVAESLALIDDALKAG